MRTNRIIVALIAAAMTVTAMPVYVTSRTNSIISTNAVDEEEIHYDLMADGVKYVRCEDHAAVCGEQFKARGEVIIPETVEFPDENGGSVRLPVTVIDDEAFFGNSGITKVVIPDSVERIGYMAFASCKSLAEIVLPEGITDIGAEFLSDTPAGEFFFGDKDVMIINGTVVDVRNTIMLEIPEGAVRIAPWLLSETWTDIRAIAFPEGLEYIGDGAFSGFFPEQIFLPSTLKEIGRNVFRTDADGPWSTGFIGYVRYAGSEEDWEKVKIGEGNDYLKSIGFNSSYPTKDTRGDFIFSYHYTDVTVDKVSPEVEGTLRLEIPIYTPCEPKWFITEIADGAFEGCDKITAIYIPRFPFTANIDVFLDCTALTDIWYSGTEREWNKFFGYIAIPNGVKMHYEENELTDPYLDRWPYSASDSGCWGDVYIGRGEYGGLTEIKDNTFSGNPHIESITFDKFVTDISGSAIRDCGGLTDVYFSDKLVNCGKYLFLSTPALRDVWYDRTFSSWQNLGERPIIPECATLHCRDSKTWEYVEVKDERDITISEFNVEGYTLMPDNSIVVCVPGWWSYVDNVTDNGIVSCRFVREDGDRNFYEFRAKSEGTEEFVVRSEYSDEEIPVTFTVSETAGTEPTEAAPAAVSESDVKGDANSDGKVTVADAVKVLQFIANQGKYPMTEKEQELADVDGSKGLTGGDATTIQKVDAGILTLD